MDVDDVNLYRRPEEILRDELRYLKARLKEERAELERYEKLRLEMGEELDGLLGSVKQDVKQTAALASEYRKLIKSLRSGDA